MCFDLPERNLMVKDTRALRGHVRINSVAVIVKTTTPSLCKAWLQTNKEGAFSFMEWNVTY